MTTAIIILFIVGILVKVSNVLKNVSQSFLYTVLSLLGLVLLFKWVLKPLYKGMLWTGSKIWEGLKRVGDFMNKHYSYRTDDNYWHRVANGADRSSTTNIIPVQRQLPTR